MHKTFSYCSALSFFMYQYELNCLNSFYNVNKVQSLYVSNVKRMLLFQKFCDNSLKV